MTRRKQFKYLTIKIGCQTALFLLIIGRLCHFIFIMGRRRIVGAYLRGKNGERFNIFRLYGRKSRSKKCPQENSSNFDQRPRKLGEFIQKDGAISLDQLRESNQAENTTFDSEASYICTASQSYGDDELLPRIDDIITSDHDDIIFFDEVEEISDLMKI